MQDAMAEPESHPELSDAVYTVQELAELLKLNPQAVRNWIDQGSLPALRIGRRVRIKREVVEDILENGLRLAEKEDGRSRP